MATHEKSGEIREGEEKWNRNGFTVAQIRNCFSTTHFQQYSQQERLARARASCLDFAELKGLRVLQEAITKHVLQPLGFVENAQETVPQRATLRYHNFAIRGSQSSGRRHGVIEACRQFLINCAIIDSVTYERGFLTLLTTYSLEQRCPTIIYMDDFNGLVKRKGFLEEVEWLSRDQIFDISAPPAQLPPLFYICALDPIIAPATDSPVLERFCITSNAVYTVVDPTPKQLGDYFIARFNSIGYGFQKPDTVERASLESAIVGLSYGQLNHFIEGCEMMVPTKKRSGVKLGRICEAIKRFPVARDYNSDLVGATFPKL